MGQHTSFEPWIRTSLLVPWSSCVSFSNSVCGLPGEKGCWRHQRCKTLEEDDVRALDLKDRSVLPYQPGRPKRSRWIVFLRSIEGGTVERVVASTRKEVSLCRRRWNAHIVVFEFDRSSSDLRPHSCECMAWFGGHHDVIQEWWDPDNPDGLMPSLFKCFGKELFEPRDLSAIRAGSKASIADLIERFLDRRCKWFRSHDLGRHFGISWCHLEVHLLERCLEEKAETFGLNDYLITFSLIDPSTLRLEHLREPHILNLDPDSDFQELRRYIEAATPLRATPSDTEMASAPVCYADCLATRSRGQLLASEIDNSFLRFSIPEVTLYLLDWLLSRILANSGDRDADAACHLRQLVDQTEDLQPIMEALLCSEVRLDLDPRIFDKEKLTRIDRRFRRLLGAYSRPVSFRIALETVDLHKGGGPLLDAVCFLCQSFAQAGYRDLPMFSDLGWQPDRRLAELDWNATDAGELSFEANSRPRALEALARVLRSVARQHVSMTPEQAEERARTLVRRSVFPIAHILSHWPPQKGVWNYYIFPIWESLIGDDYRPSIFAHVFSARRPGDDEDADKVIKEEAEFLNAQLLSFGRLIAQSRYDDQLRRSQIDGRLAAAAYSIGHPMKRRVESVRAELNSMLDLRPDADTTSLIHAAGQAASRVGRLGHVLDVLASSLRPGESEKTFQREREWHDHKPFRFDVLVTELDEARLAPGARPVKVTMSASVGRIGIVCWLKDESGRPFRPADLFYEELIFELFFNATKHGGGDRDGVPVEVQYDELWLNDGPVQAITLVNEIDASQAVETSEWAMWNEHDDAPVGGLYFLAGLLDRAGLGRLWTRIERRRDRFFFFVALELNGLERLR